MNKNSLYILKNNDNLMEYFFDNSYLYKNLNRDHTFIKKINDDYKKYKRDNSLNKINDYLDNFDMLATLIKMK